MVDTILLPNKAEVDAHTTSVYQKAQRLEERSKSAAMNRRVPTITYMKIGTNKAGVPKWKALFRLPKEDGERQGKVRAKVFHAPKQQAIVLAEAWRDEVLNIPKDVAEMTLAELMDDFYLRCKDVKLSCSTLRSYKVAIERRIKPYFKNKLAIDLTQREVEDFYRYLREEGRFDGAGGLSDSTVRATHVVLHKAYKDAIRRGELTKNPVQVKLPKIHREEALPFSYAEIAKLNKILETLDNANLKEAIMIGLHLSLRLGEVCGLQWGDIEGPMISVKRGYKENGTYGVPKTKKSKRKIALTPELENFLREHQRSQRAVLERLDIKQTSETPILADELGRPSSINYISGVATPSRTVFIRLVSHIL